MAGNASTFKQVPDNSILDYFNRQSYLGNAYSFPIGPEVLESTTETNITLISNPASSTVSLFLNLRTTASDSATGDGTSFFRYYINPTVSTTGTKTPPQNLRPSAGDNSQAACYVNGQFTTSANGTLLRVITAGYSSINDSNVLIILDPGYSLLVTAQAVTSGSTIINANSWYEISYGTAP
jgi:hypothetical protein